VDVNVIWLVLIMIGSGVTGLAMLINGRKGL